MRRKLTFVALAIGLTSLIAWTCLRNTSMQSTVVRQPMGAVVPAGGIRFAANHITAGQVEFITFSGPAMGCYDEECLHISNKKAIEGFLQALRSATTRRGE